MQAKNPTLSPEDLFRNRFDLLLNDKHPLFRLSESIDWDYFVGEFGPLYVENKGRPGKPVRLLVALHYLKHTYNQSDESVVERLTNYQVKEACCDRGYRGHNYEGDATVHIVGQRQRGSPVTRSLRKWLRRRNAIEPKTGHLKEDNRMNRNYLKGTNGDRVNALLAGCGANLRKLMAAFFLPFLEIRRFLEKITNNFQRTIKTETPVLMNTV